MKFSFSFKFISIFFLYRSQKTKVCSCKFYYRLIISFRSRETFIDPPREALTPQSLLIPTPVKNEDTINRSQERQKSSPLTTPPNERLSVTPDK